MLAGGPCKDTVGVLLRVAKGIDKLWSHARDVSRLEAWTFSGIHLALAEDMPALSGTAP